MSELHHLLSGFEDTAAAEASGRTLDDVAQHRVRTAITRKRRVRVAVTAAAAVAASVAIGSGAWAAFQYGADAPVATTTPSPTASATPTPSASASPSPEPVLTMPDFSGDVTVDDRLPSALPITPEAWNAAGPGWVLATYQEQVYLYEAANDEGHFEYGPQVAYLISPEGDRYEVSRLADDTQYYIVAWDPQASVAFAVSEDPDMTRRWVTLDLVTGEARDATDADVVAAKWTEDDFLAMWSEPSWWEPESFSNTPPRLPAGPGGTTPAVDIDSARTTALSLVADGETCDDIVTLESGDVAVACGSEVEYPGNDQTGPFFDHSVVFVSDLGRGAGVAVDITRTYPAEDNEYVDSWTEAGSAITPFANGVRVELSDVGFSPCPAGVAFATPSGVAPLAGVEALKAGRGAVTVNLFEDAGTSGSSLYTAVFGGCSGDLQPIALVRDDVATGDYSVLVPFPAAAVEWTTGSEILFQSHSLRSAYVVPDWKTGE